jgi:hypothetical protein
MVQGNCLCGQIHYEATQIPGMVFNCHCSRCRKAHGAAFATQVICHKESLRFLAGREKLSEFIVGNIVRTFCGNCGSRLMNYTVGPEYLSVSLSSLKECKDLRPVGECFVLDKLPFVPLDCSIAHYHELPLIL